jgi:hypothetical protein
VTRRAWLAAPAGAALACVQAAPAEAHGIVERTNLPIPAWLFGWAAAAVLVASFAGLALLWPRPRLQQPGWRALPAGLGRILGGRVVAVTCALIGVALLAVIVVAGFTGGSSGLDNLAPTAILIDFWVGLAFVSVLLGDLFRAFSPWRALRLPGLRPYPERLGRLPAAGALLGFTWIELVSGWGEAPATLATAVLAYTAYTLAMQAVFGTEAWTRNGEAFAVYFNLFARMSPFETRDRVVGVRSPLGGLPQLDAVGGTVVFVCVMIGTVTFDGFTQSPAWVDASRWLADAVDGLVGAEAAPKLAGTVGLVAAVAFVAVLYEGAIAGVRSVDGSRDSATLGRAFVHTLVPIALAYVAAHYLTLLLFEGQATFYLASDPFGQGWDLFGTAARGIDYSFLGPDAIWYVQVAFVVAGHVAGLVLAHDRALALYPDVRTGLRSQYWMLAVMVGFTSLALFLLAGAGT